MEYCITIDAILDHVHPLSVQILGSLVRLECSLFHINIYTYIGATKGKLCDGRILLATEHNYLSGDKTIHHIISIVRCTKPCMY